MSVDSSPYANRKFRLFSSTRKGTLLESVRLGVTTSGNAPSAHPLSEQKLYSVVSVPFGVILKTVPYPTPLEPQGNSDPDPPHVVP
ncbi:MAG TPA: hypothetical protein VMR62_23935 [Bryobacteraceae bacterium]|nr:hypothetical protein [Bryobacteraceae bacterium]